MRRRRRHFQVVKDASDWDDICGVPSPPAAPTTEGPHLEVWLQLGSYHRRGTVASVAEPDFVFISGDVRFIGQCKWFR
jgi:hypothetical protein